jgi:CubicO group peptidase (beta-lactamase class C family)
MSSHALAQHQTFEDIVSSVESAADTPNIDAAVVTLDGLCTLSDESGLVDSTTRSRFHAASISKLFTATVIMQLRDEGALSLQDKVGIYESAFSDSPIRIEHLLTHTSGLEDRKRADGRTTGAEVDTYIRSLAKQRTGSTPGSDWRYADAGFNLLGRIIERVTGKPYSIVLKERLLRPLGMQDSTFDLSQIPIENRVQAYDKRGNPRQHPWDLAFLPSSGLQTTATDLAIFAQAVLRISGSGPMAIVSLESLHEMTTVRISTEWDGVAQGYGWQLVDTHQGRQWRHAGGEAGFESLLTLYPEAGFAIAVLGNKQDWPRFEFEKEILSQLVKTPNMCAGN